MRKILVLVSLLVFIVTGTIFAKVSVNKEESKGLGLNFSQKVIKSMSSLYGYRFAQLFKDAKVEKVENIKKGKGWRVDLYKIIPSEQTKKQTKGQAKTLPVIITKLGKNTYITPAMINMEKARNDVVIWGLKAKESLNVNLTKEKLIYGNTNQCKHNMEIFSDPQCPFCRRFLPMFIDIAKENNLCLYYYSFPLSFHKYAKEYSRYLESLLHYVKQGKRLDILLNVYKNAEDPDTLKKYVNKQIKKLKIKKDKFYQYMANQANDTIDKDIKIGQDIGLMGTPTVLIDKKLVANNMLKDVIKSLK